eukprot:gene9192-1278_t
MNNFGNSKIYNRITSSKDKFIFNSKVKIALILFVSLFTTTFSKHFYGCGSNSYNLLTKESPGDPSIPGKMDTDSNTTQVASGHYYNTYVMKKDGTVYATGKNHKGQLGDGTYNYQQQLTKTKVQNAKKIYVGQMNCFVVTNDGELFGFGENTYGQLGDGTDQLRENPTKIPGMNDVKEVATGLDHTLVLVGNGTIFSFGKNLNGQLGHSNKTNTNVPSKVNIISPIVHIAAGHTHSLVLSNNTKHFYGFGSNNNAELGFYNPGSYDIPQQVIFLIAIEQFACGNSFSMILTQFRTVYVFGINNVGQLGTGETTPINTPTLNTNLINIKQLSCGKTHCLALNSNGTVFSFGENNKGQLGDGTKTNSLIPIDIKVANATQVSAGVELSSVLDSNGNAFSFGDDTHGQLGRKLIPFQFLRDFSVSDEQHIGLDFSLLLTTRGKIYGIGKNSYGQLGDGTKFSKIRPTLNPVLKDVIQVSVGAHFSLVLFRSQTVGSFGRNNDGQLGTGDRSDTADVSNVIGATNITQISAGGYHSLILASNGTVYSFGNNLFGQLGTGTTTFADIPQTTVGGNTRVISQLSAGNYYSLLLSSTGIVFSFGKNSFAQLGIDNTRNQVIPMEIQITNISTISAGNTHSLIINETGHLFGFGSNNGELTIGGTVAATTVKKPAWISFDSKIKQVRAGDKSSYVVDENGFLFVFGDNSFGKLCDGSFLTRKLPTRVPSTLNLANAVIQRSYSLTPLASFSFAYNITLITPPEFGCFGKKSTEASVCSSYGTCISVDTCSCFTGYSGLECEKTRCFGVLSSDPSVCSSNGICSAPDRCLCEKGFTGNNCSTNTTQNIVVSPQCVVFDDNYITYYQKEMKYFLEANICSSKSGWGGISFHQKDGMSTASFIIVSWIQNGFTHFKELKYHSINGINRFQEYPTLGIKLPKDQSLEQYEFNDKQRFSIEIDEELLKKYDYITIACNINPIVSNSTFSYHQTIKTVNYNVTSASLSVCDVTVLSGFSKRISDVNSTVWIVELSFYIIFFFVAFFHISETSTTSLYFKFITLLKYLSKPLLILWISLGFLLLSSMVDLAVIFIIPAHFQCTTTKSYIIYGIHLCFNLFFGSILFFVLLVDIILSIINLFRDYFRSKLYEKHAFLKSILGAIQNFLYKNDPYYFRLEQFFAFSIFIFYVLLEFSAYNSLIFGSNSYNFYVGQYLNVYGRSIIAYSFVVYQAFFPFCLTLFFKFTAFLRRIFKRNKKRLFYMEECLANEQSFGLFFKFAVEEWAQENLVAWRSIEKYKKATGENKRNIAFDIYYCHLNGDMSPLEINIDSKNCVKVFKIINDDTLILENNVFEDVEKVLKVNISDTYARFIYTDAYQNFGKNSEFREEELKEIKGF